MKTKEIADIINKHQADIAFIVGNGVNRYENKQALVSWDTLIKHLWKKFSSNQTENIPEKIQLTELYDILEIIKVNNLNIQNEVVQILNKWDPFDQHVNIVNKAMKINAPILTTNFDESLAKSFNSKIFQVGAESLSPKYPWTTYHGNMQLNLPTDGFGIWYINGMLKYQSSIRLGLTHYMGCVQKARRMIYRKNSGLFSEKEISNWQGNSTWLNVIFHKSLFIFGVELEESEVFLRWLLIERKRYFNKFQNREQKGWYVCCEIMDAKKRFFLENVGISVIDVKNYSDIYNIFKF